MLPPPKSNADAASSVEKTALPVAIVLKEEEVWQPTETQARPESKKQRHSYRKAQPISHGNREESRPSKLHARGISYNTPFKCYVGALATVCFLITLFLSFLIPVHLFLTREIGLIDITVLMLMVFSGILYLTVALQCRCRTCRVQLFSLKHFLRHKKAHHIPLLGHNISTGLHILLFFWFRCQACGTSQKLSQK